MPQTDFDTDILPFINIPGIHIKERGKAGKQKGYIFGVKFSFQLGDLAKQSNGHAVMIPQFPYEASERSVAGGFVRSNYRQDILSYAQELKNNKGPFQYGDLIPAKIMEGKEQTDFGKPDYFFHAVTVTEKNEPHLQFNAIRKSVKKAGYAAVGLSTDEKTITNILLPAFGTGPAGHMKGFQSARAIFAGINDFGLENDNDRKEHIHYHIIIKDSSIYAPIIEEFMQVIADLSYLDVPPAGEVGLKKINQNMIDDHICMEKAMTKAYNDELFFNQTYSRYDNE